MTKWAGPIAVLAAACGGGSDPMPDAGGTPVEVEADLALVPEHELDLLVVINTTLSTGEELQILGNDFPALLDAISGGGELPDLHLGIVTSDLGALGVDFGDPQCTGTGDAGNLQTNECAGITESFISDVADGTGGRIRNYSGDLASLVSCMLFHRDDGCGFPQPLESMRMALDNNPANAGFLRDTAQLAVIVHSEDDDCSAYNPAFYGPESAELGPLDLFRCFEFGIVCDQADPRVEGEHTGCRSNESSPHLNSVGEYLDFLDGLRPDRTTFSAIIGPSDPIVVGRRIPTGGGEPRPSLQPSCSYVDPNGTTNRILPGIRLEELAESMGGAAASMCQADVTSTLTAIGSSIHQQLVGQPCVRGGEIVDADRDAPGLQPACTVTVVGIDEPAQPLAACNADATNQPCWRLVEDVAQCGPLPARRLDAPGVAPVYGRHVRARCLVVP